MKVLGLEIIGKTNHGVPTKRSSDNPWIAITKPTNVTPQTAVQLGSVYACVQRYASTLASLPFLLYRKLSTEGKERATDLPLYRLLNLAPNPNQTRFEFVELMVWHLLLRGNCFILMQFDRGGVSGFELLHPDKVTVIKDVLTNKVHYKYRPGSNKVLTYTAEDIIHLKYHSDDGIVGKGPIQVAREAVENGLTLDQYQKNFYQKGTKLSGVLEHPETLDDDTAKRIADSFRTVYSGVENAGKVAVLEEGMKFNPISISPVDAQFLESKKYNRSEIAMIFLMPPHMIGDLERATFSNIEHQSIEFVTHSIRPLGVRIEQSFNKALIAETEQETLFIEFLLDALLRGDTKSRYEAYQMGLQNGFLRLNDVRERENLNPLPWGDATMIPLNMRPITKEEDLFAAVADTNKQDDSTKSKDKSDDSEDETPAAKDEEEQDRKTTAQVNRRVASELLKFITRKALSREKIALDKLKEARTEEFYLQKVNDYINGNVKDILFNQISEAITPCVVDVSTCHVRDKSFSDLDITIQNRTKELAEKLTTNFLLWRHSDLVSKFGGGEQDDSTESEAELLSFLDTSLGDYLGALLVSGG